MRNFALLLIGLFMAASGCANVGPDFTPPVAPVADSWLEVQGPVLSATPGQYEDWWTVFNDPVLNGLVEEASRENLGLQVAGLRILEARAQLGIASGYLYPQQQNAEATAATVDASSNAAAAGCLLGRHGGNHHGRARLWYGADHDRGSGSLHYFLQSEIA